MLVPFTPTSVLLCRYAGMNPPSGTVRWGLLASATLTGDKANRLADTLNSTAQPLPTPAPSSTPGAWLCAADTGDEVDAFFSTAGQTLQVSIPLNGCEVAFNGSLALTIADSDTSTYVESLVPVPGYHNGFPQ